MKFEVPLEVYIDEIPMGGTYHDRSKSAIVDFIMHDNYISASAAASVLECSRQYFNNKLSRNSFSIEDIAKIADAAGYTICMVGTASWNAGKLYNITRAVLGKEVYYGSGTEAVCGKGTQADA